MNIWLWLAVAALGLAVAIAVGRLLLPRWFLWEGAPRESREEKRFRRFRFFRAYAVTLLDCHMYRRAAHAMRCALSLNRHDPEALHAMGRIQQALDKPRLARDYFRVALAEAEKPVAERRLLPPTFSAEVLVDDARSCAMLHQTARNDLERIQWREAFVDAVRRANQEHPTRAQELLDEENFPPELMAGLEGAPKPPVKRKKK